MNHNQDSLKKILDGMVDEPFREYQVIFSGKKSKVADGVYYPEKKEIIIHNRNFKLWNTLVLTGIHELAHHVEFQTGRGVSNRAHGKDWKSTYYSLLKKAIAEKIYEDPFNNDGPIQEEAVNVRTIDNRIAALNKEFGRVLLSFYSECMEKGHDFQDFTDRILGRTKEDIKTVMKAFAMDETSEYGVSGMNQLVKAGKGNERDSLEVRLSEGLPAVQPRETLAADQDAETSHIMKELNKLEKRIAHDLERKQNLEVMLAALEGKEQ